MVTIQSFFRGRKTTRKDYSGLDTNAGDTSLLTSERLLLENEEIQVQIFLAFPRCMGLKESKIDFSTYLHRPELLSAQTTN